MKVAGGRRGAAGLAAVCLGVVVLTGCGDGDDAGAGGASPSTEYAEDSTVEHDRAWPDVAAKCRDVPSAPAAGTGDGADGGNGGDSGPEPENPKNAENHAYKQTTDVPPGELCRGEAHAALIATALADADPGDLKNERRIRLILEGLGHAPESVSAREGGSSVVWWDVKVVGAGPCLSGSTDRPGEIDVHGVYMEGGCTEPAGGH